MIRAIRHGHVIRLQQSTAQSWLRMATELKIIPSVRRTQTELLNLVRSTHARGHTLMCACVCKWMWDLWSVLPRRLAICNDWQELIQQMMESHYVPDRLELKTAILPYDVVTGHRLNRGSHCQCKKHDFFFFWMTNSKNNNNILIFKIHFLYK